MKKRLMIVFIFMVLFGLIACSKTETEKEATMSIKPVDLFAGEAAKFEPFLGNFSGAVHIKYAGVKKYLEAKFDIWENGEKTKTVGSFGISLVEINGRYTFDGEVIISINEFNYEEETSYYMIKTALVGGLSQIRLEKDEKYTLFSTLTLQEPIQVSEKEPALVWGVQATDKNLLSGFELTEENLAQTDWALVLTIELSDKSM